MSNTSPTDPTGVRSTLNLKTSFSTVLDGTPMAGTTQLPSAFRAKKLPLPPPVRRTRARIVTSPTKRAYCTANGLPLASADNCLTERPAQTTEQMASSALQSSSAAERSVSWAAPAAEGERRPMGGRRNGMAASGLGAGRGHWRQLAVSTKCAPGQ